MADFVSITSEPVAASGSGPTSTPIRQPMYEAVGVSDYDYLDLQALIAAGTAPTGGEVLVNSTTAARPNQTGLRPSAMRVLPEATNLDFSTWDAGLPVGWTVPFGIDALHYELSMGKTAHGRSAIIGSVREPRGVVGAGTLSQEIDAGAFKGHCVRLRVRFDRAVGDARVFLRFRSP